MLCLQPSPSQSGYTIRFLNPPLPRRERVSADNKASPAAASAAACEKYPHSFPGRHRKTWRLAQRWQITLNGGPSSNRWPWQVRYAWLATTCCLVQRLESDMVPLWGFQPVGCARTFNSLGPFWRSAQSAVLQWQVWGDLVFCSRETSLFLYIYLSIYLFSPNTVLGYTLTWPAFHEIYYPMGSRPNTMAKYLDTPLVFGSGSLHKTRV